MIYKFTHRIKSNFIDKKMFYHRRHYCAIQVTPDARQSVKTKDPLTVMKYETY